MQTASNEPTTAASPLAQAPAPSRVAMALLAAPDHCPPPAYTHAVHATRCREAAQCRQVLRQFVQVKVFRVTQCARVVEAWTTSDGLDMWSLQLHGPFFGRASVPASRAVQCSGIDGRCVCAGELGATE